MTWLKGRQERRKPSPRLAKSTPSIISLTTSSLSVLWEIFIFLPSCTLVTKEFHFPLKWLSSERKWGSGNNHWRKAAKPQLHLVPLEPAGCFCLKLCVLFCLCLFHLFLLPLGLCLLEWQNSEISVNSFFLKLIYSLWGPPASKGPHYWSLF